MSLTSSQLAATLDAPHAMAVQEVASALQVDLHRGLSAAEAARRLEQYGPNELPEEAPTPTWQRLLAQFTSVLVLLLLAAAAVSFLLWLIERDSNLPFEAIVILAIVILNAVLGYVQESRAEQAVNALRAMGAAEARVLRDGEVRRVRASDVVPGDVLVLEEGDAVPADARVLHVASLQAAEAALTGESLPVSKRLDPVEVEVGLGDRRSMLFSGTNVTYGRGQAIATATGTNTEVGRIAGMLQHQEQQRTPLQAELDKTGKRLGLIVLVLAVIMVGTLLLVGGAEDVSQVLEALVLGVALAVAAVPEGLPAIVTAVLAIGTQRMAKRNAIIRKLPAVETLGSATVIASDKTGTLTRNEMTVRAVVTASGRTEVHGTGYAPEGSLEREGKPLSDPGTRAEVRHLLRAAALANNAVLREEEGRWEVLGDPTEGALKVAASKAGLGGDELQGRFPRVAEVPFSSERKRMSTAHADRQENRTLLFAKGAPDVLITHCTHELIGGEAVPLSEERRDAVRADAATLASEALRTLAIAFRTLPPEAPASEEVEEDLVLLGLVGMMDPPRPEARAAVARALSAGIRPLMITGDHPVTALAVARQLGIAQGDRVVSGAEVERMDEATLDRTVQEANVFARVDPAHKLRLVESLQRQQEVVAMTGDGVNDAPALKKADIGIAMGITGTDVSKAAADMVLADDNFATIVSAVEEGRGIFSNIRKFLRYLLSSNTGEVITMFFGVILAPVLGLSGGEGLILPLLATQILWINLLTDGPPALALGLEPPDADVMMRRPRPRGEGVITGRMWAGIFLVGTVMAAGTLGVLDAGLPGGLIPGEGSIDRARTMAFTTLVLQQLVNVFNSRSDDTSAFRHIFRNVWLWAAIGLSLLLQLAVVYLPFLQNAFSTVPLTLGEWGVCLLVASSVLFVREIFKWLTRPRNRMVAQPA